MVVMKEALEMAVSRDINAREIPGGHTFPLE
jgi:hypothetical protein